MRASSKRSPLTEYGFYFIFLEIHNPTFLWGSALHNAFYAVLKADYKIYTKFPLFVKLIVDRSLTNSFSSSNCYSILRYPSPSTLSNHSEICYGTKKGTPETINQRNLGQVLHDRKGWTLYLFYVKSFDNICALLLSLRLSRIFQEQQKQHLR